MLLLHDDGCVEELIAHNELCDIVAEQHDRESRGEEGVYTFCKITDHQGPLKKGDHNHNGSSWNLKVLWEDGAHTWEPLNAMIGACLLYTSPSPRDA